MGSFFANSPERIRTSSLVVTSALKFPPGLDYLILLLKKRRSGAHEAYWKGILIL